MIINNPMKNTPLTFKFYNACPQLPDRNAIIDDIEGWLSYQTPILTITSTNPFELSMTQFKINASDSNAFIISSQVQYMSVKWADRYHAYYWVKKINRSSNDVITLDIELDFLNTLNNGDDTLGSPLYAFNPLSSVEREHVDRFYNDLLISETAGYKDIKRAVDRVNEGVETKTFHILDDDISIEPKSTDALTELIDHTCWYMVYVTIPNRRNPVIYLIPEYRTSQWEIPISPSSNMKLIDAGYLDRSNSNIIKIVKTPYCPVDFYWNSLLQPTTLAFDRCNVTHPEIDIFDGRIVDLNNIWVVQYLEGYEANKAFSRALTSDKYTGLVFNNSVFVHKGSLDYLLNDLRYIKDTKLESSEFVTDLIVYDSYSVQFKAENYTASFTPDITLSYAQSTALDSSLIFRLNNYYYQREQNYADMIASVRKNEIPLYTNDFINYMRNGYNYDRTKQVLSTAVNILGSGVSLGTSISSGNPLGVVASGMGLTRSISGAISGEVDFQKNLNNLKNKATNVSDINDSSLFEFYGKSRPRRITMEMTHLEQERWNDIFYYYGYNRGGIMKVPNVNSRVWFNYLKGEIVLGSANYLPLWLYEKVKAKFREGVTYYHCQTINGYKAWDLPQTKENYETFLLNL